MDNRVRLILGPPRSGTSMLQAALCQHPKVYGIYEPQRAIIWKEASDLAFQDVFQTPQRVFELFSQKKSTENLDSPDTIFVSKEVLGKILIHEPEDLIPSGTQIAYIFKSPLSAFNSMLRNSQNLVFGMYSNIEFFIGRYKKHADFMRKLIKNNFDIMAINFEDFVKQSESKLRELCKRWGISFSDKMLDWEHTGEGLWDKIAMNPTQRQALRDSSFHNVLMNNKRISPNISDKPLYTEEQSRLINQELGGIYNELNELTERN